MNIISDKQTILKELFRKSIHLCSAFIPFFLARIYWVVIIGLLLVVTLYLISEVLRLKGIALPVIAKVTEIAARQRDENKIVWGPVTLVFGIILVSLLLPLEYAQVGIYALAFGDGFASLIGKLFGRIVIPFTGKKTLEGSLACFTAVFISTIIVSKNPLVALLVALLAMIIEVLPLKDFDNLVIPVCVGYWYFVLIELIIPHILVV